MYHTPVLLSESVQGLNIQPNGIYVDATFGGGGHSKAILQQLGDTGKLFAFDQDEDAQTNTQQITDSRFAFIPQNFKHCKRFLRLYGVQQVDGILADLGISWHQINTPKRGFSTRFDDQLLDMRMDQESEINAANILKKYTKEKLYYIFKTYGELPKAYRVAEAVSQMRQQTTIETAEQLKRVVRPFVVGKENKYFAQLFQALRIAVNDELGALQDLLNSAVTLLKPTGRLVVIAYHSVEDRLVKNFFKKGSFDGTEQKDLYGRSQKPFQVINKKVIVPNPKELYQNPKSRSAKLRIAQRVSSQQSKFFS